MNRALAIALVAWGFLGMLGFALGSTTLRGIAALSCASPLPLVFTEFRGVETFAARFRMELERRDGSRREAEITPALYGDMDGPYNRRNAYGAVIAYGPALTEPNEKAMLDSVLAHGLCNGGPLARRFGEAEPLARATVVVRTMTRGRDSEWRHTVECR